MVVEQRSSRHTSSAASATVETTSQCSKQGHDHKRGMHYIHASMGCAASAPGQKPKGQNARVSRIGCSLPLCVEVKPSRSARFRPFTRGAGAREERRLLSLCGCGRPCDCRPPSEGEKCACAARNSSLSKSFMLSSDMRRLRPRPRRGGVGLRIDFQHARAVWVLRFPMMPPSSHGGGRAGQACTVRASTIRVWGA